jgi:hypothetical protein
MLQHVMQRERERERLIYTLIYNWPQWSDLVDFREKRARGHVYYIWKLTRCSYKSNKIPNTHSPNSTFKETKLQNIPVSFLCEVNCRFGSVMGSYVHGNDPKKGWIIFWSAERLSTSAPWQIISWCLFVEW